MTEEEKIIRGTISGSELLKMIDGRIEIKIITIWPEALELTDKNKSVNITKPSGWTRLLNMTGADVQELEEQYIVNVVDLVRHLLLHMIF